MTYTSIHMQSFIDRWLLRRDIRNILFWFLVPMLHVNVSFQKEYFPVQVVLLVSFGIPAYVNNLILIPRYLMRGKTIHYLLQAAVLMVCVYVESLYIHAIAHRIFPDVEYFRAFIRNDSIYFIFPPLVTIMLLAFGKFAADAVQNQRKVDSLEHTRLTSELESLRSQINPHFLFNALNTVYGIALRTDKETADAVHKLSDILRHSLYECEGEISIQKEILFLQQYIHFTKLRLHDETAISFNVDAETQYHKIAPLLLMPFVENAIKHGLDSQPTNAFVEIDLIVSDNKLLFLCNNSMRRIDHNQEEASSGIGLKNVRRRLELLYPGKHTLTVLGDCERFIVELQIQLV